jgi:hypothetical protein
MSHASQPSIPFVLPLYEKMDRHLLDATRNSALPYIIRSAAISGREKLLKYKGFAVTNQFYVIGTSKYIYLYYFSIENVVVI